MGKLWRRYVASAKHQPGGAGTLMPLSGSVAETVLNRGIEGPNGRQIYGVYENQCFEFQPEAMGTFHGYPVPGGQVPPAVLGEMVATELITPRIYRELLSESRKSADENS